MVYRQNFSLANPKAWKNSIIKHDLQARNGLAEHPLSRKPAILVPIFLYEEQNRENGRRRLFGQILDQKCHSQLMLLTRLEEEARAGKWALPREWRGGISSFPVNCFRTGFCEAECRLGWSSATFLSAAIRIKTSVTVIWVLNWDMSVEWHCIRNWNCPFRIYKCESYDCSSWFHESAVNWIVKGLRKPSIELK